MTYVLQNKKLTMAAIAWLLCMQYYVVQIIVASSWQGTVTFSWLHNTISDLGATLCGQYNDRLVCSPDHGLMNVSFIVLGVTQALGAWLLSSELHNKLTRLGSYCFYIAAIGTIMVAAFPENHSGPWHMVGAAMALAVGNVGLTLYGLGLGISDFFRRITIGMGAIGLIALVLFVCQVDLGIGSGFMERIAAYPQSIWMMLFGTYLITLKTELLQ